MGWVIKRARNALWIRGQGLPRCPHTPSIPKKGASYRVRKLGHSTMETGGRVDADQGKAAVLNRERMVL